MMPREHCGTFIKCNNAEGCQGCEYELEQENTQLKDRIATLEDALKRAEGNKTKCSRCGYEGQDTSKYGGLCYQCYADINNIQ